MKFRSSMLLVAALAAFALAGCGGDMAKQLAGNEQVRTQVMDAIAGNKDLAMQAVDRLMASDSLRAQVIDHLLTHDQAAMQVLVRIGTNPDALDQVIGVAAKDSVLRDHMFTLIKGMEMASGK
ncbi:MAG: hypothetical protein IT348_16580 [Candidatus Eisenbacteria bacterium]|nr:hypothetical protein [Candidatus Eisenbacteria bacterium]